VTAPTRTLSFGVKTSPQFVEYDEIVRVWREADDTPEFEHAWVFDHFYTLGPDPTGTQLEGWTLLAALAAQTHRLRVGTLVTGVTYRHPAVLANMGVTVDIISKGRLDFGIGAAWHEMEHNAYGIPFPSAAERIRRLGEACELIRRLWTEPRVTYEGRYYQLHDAMCNPKPIQKPYPPFMIGGGGEQLTLRVVARYADIWNFSGQDVEAFRHKSELLDGYCREIGRDPAAIQRSAQFGVRPGDDLATLPGDISPYIEAGVTHIIFNLVAPYATDVVPRLAREVVRPLREQFAA
jgi:F420-dependent oxidoreductase-like protein